MKILLVHNFYQSSSPSGEDTVFKNEVELLKENGIEVITYENYNDDALSLNKIRLGFRTIWSKETYKDLRDLIKKEKPDIAHFHNIWYLISPSAYYACKDAGVPVVQTLHNFRLFCVNGLLLRKGKVCEDCLRKVPWRGAIRGCYRNSIFYSAPVALTEFIHKVIGTWNDNVNAYIALTEFGREKYIEGGLPAEKIFVKPNFLVHPPEPSFNHKDYAVFLGRLSLEKGLWTLIEAWKEIKGITLKVMGDGPLRKDLEDFVSKYRIENIEFTGKKEFNDCMELLKGSLFMIMPSVWYETFGISVIEAFACGKPVIASRLGAMAELVEDYKTGLLFEHGNPEDLAEKIRWMLDNEEACIEIGRNARAEFEAKYTAEKNFEISMEIYKKTIENKGNG
ncbi:MAG: glycosyltransferase family 4 protein [Nanoarchaeota archaeon]|nr:glycosyltransferase family 4 protein [Nanoarchaeota archaeon]